MTGWSRGDVGARGHPRLWHHDYLHLRPLSRDLRSRIGGAVTTSRFRTVLDLGAGDSPYSDLFGGAADLYVRLDREPSGAPSVVGLAEEMPFQEGAFDAVLSTQLLGLVRDPEQVGREIGRVTRPGGRVWLSGPAAWPYDSASPEHRFGEPDLPRLFPDLVVKEIVRQGGMLALPFALLNIGVREAVRSAEKRFGGPARTLRAPAAALFLLSNSAGRALERLAARGPLSRFLGYLDARMPMNYLVVAEKPQ